MGKSRLSFFFGKDSMKFTIVQKIDQDIVLLILWFDFKLRSTALQFSHIKFELKIHNLYEIYLSHKRVQNPLKMEL